MNAVETYNQINEDIQSVLEILERVPAWEKDYRAPKEKKSVLETAAGNFHTSQMIYTGELFVLAEFIRKHCGVDLPHVSNRPSIRRYLECFRANKDKIIAGFEDVIGHPEKRVQWGWEQYTTFETLLGYHRTNIHNKTQNIELEFEKLILKIDSEDQEG